MSAHGFTRKSGFAMGHELKQSLGFLPDLLGQSCPQDCPTLSASELTTRDEVLGQPLGITEVAKLIGCSAWTVRQRHIAQGLPHFRSGPNGKLIFYRNQVIRWLLRQQEKGGSNL